MACKQKKFPGKLVVIEYVIGCPDALPETADWKRLGAMRTKEYTLTWDSTDATDDSSVGSIRENLMTFLSVELSGDGTVKNDGSAYAEAVIELEEHVSNPVSTGGQPSAWFRITDPRLTRTVYMNIGEFSPLSAPYDDVTTWSFSASATASDYGLIVERTPDPDAIDPESIDAVPDTLSLTVGESFTAQAVVLPVGAPQGVRWTSSNPAFATVGLVSGEIKAVAAGSVTITAASTVDAGVTATVSVTVVPQVSGITVSPTAVSVEEGATQALTASVTPAGAAPGLVYASANPAVATVSSSGVVTGVAAGSTTVTITSAARPSVSVTVPMEVTEP